MCDSVWETLAHHYRVRRDDPTTWKAQRISGAKDRPKRISFEDIVNQKVHAVLDQLLGADRWERSEFWGVPLVSFPGAFPEAPDGWFLPHQGWHLDAPVVRALPDLYGVRMFTCLSKLEPQGGATLAVAGSHRLAQALTAARGLAKMRSGDVRKGLIRHHRWMRELCSVDAPLNRIERFMNTDTAVEDVQVRVIEMTGEPGDVYLAHPLIMHAASPNCLAQPRLALTSTVYLRGIDWNALYGPERDAAA